MAQQIAETDDDGDFTFDRERVRVLLTRNEEAMFVDDFLDTHPQTGEEVLDVGFVGGRDWEPEQTENGETIRTQVSPSIRVFERVEGDGHHVLLCVNGLDAVYTAFYVMEELYTFLTALTESFEAGFDGIDRLTHRRLYDNDHQSAMDAIIGTTIKLLTSHFLHKSDEGNEGSLSKSHKQAVARVFGTDA